MGVVSSAFEMAFREMLANGGESIVLPSGVVVSGLVRRDVVAQARRAGLPDYTTRASVSVEIATPARKPRVGEAFTSAADPAKRYRIKEAFDETGYSMRFVCEPYEVTS